MFLWILYEHRAKPGHLLKNLCLSPEFPETMAVLLCQKGIESAAGGDAAALRSEATRGSIARGNGHVKLYFISVTLPDRLLMAPAHTRCL